MPAKDIESFVVLSPPTKIAVTLGTVNLARDRKVTSSGSSTNLHTITNGDKSFRPAEEVEKVGLGKQWIQVDLGAVADIYAIAIWHSYYYKNWVFFDVVVQVSDDPEFKQDVRTVFNNDTENHHGVGVGKDRLYFESHWGKLVDAHGIKGRYVRLYSSGSNLSKYNDYLQIEVYGK